MTVESLRASVGAAVFDTAARDAMKLSVVWGGPASTTALELAYDEIWKTDWDLVSDWNLVRFSCELYHIMPTHTLLFWMWIERELAEYNDEARSLYWAFVRSCLGASSHALAAPASYHLWSCIFEGDYVVEGWTALVVDKTEMLTSRLLKISGPVPYKFKEQLYATLLPEFRWHHDILISLVGSVFDTYGKVDRNSALNILSSLTLDQRDEQVRELLSLRLADPDIVGAKDLEQISALLGPNHRV